LNSSHRCVSNGHAPLSTQGPKSFFLRQSVQARATPESSRQLTLMGLSTMSPGPEIGSACIRARSSRRANIGIAAGRDRPAHRSSLIEPTKSGCCSWAGPRAWSKRPSMGEPLSDHASGTLAKVVGGNSQVEFSVKGFAPDGHIVIEMSEDEL